MKAILSSKDSLIKYIKNKFDESDSFFKRLVNQVFG